MQTYLNTLFLFQQRAAVIEAWQSQGGVLLMVTFSLNFINAAKIIV